MINPFSSAPHAPPAKHTRLHKTRKPTAHPNNPYYHRFPLLHRMEELFVGALTRRVFLLDHMPRRTHLFMCLFYVSCLVAAFVYLFLRGYRNARSVEYLAPSDGQNESDNCELIPSTNSGTFYATVDGYWQGSEYFVFSRAAYVLVLSSFSASKANYNQTFGRIFNYLTQLGAVSANLDLSKNLLIWMTTTNSTDQSNTHRFFLVGNPSIVLNRQVHLATIATDAFACNTSSSTASLDVNSGILSTSFPSALFTSESSVNHSPCAHVFSASLFGFDKFAHPKDFDIPLDVRTLITAVGLNTRYSKDMVSIRVRHLVAVEPLNRVFVNGASTLLASAYYDAKHPGMVPVFCVNSSQLTDPLCLLQIGGVPVLPFFHHVGQRDDAPQRCDCATLNRSALSDTHHVCNSFRFLTGFYFFNSTDIAPLLEVIHRHESVTAFHDAGYSAAFLSSSFGLRTLQQQQQQQQSGVNASISTRREREKAFDFCRSATHGACSAFVVSSFDLFERGASISEYSFQLTHGTCNDTIRPNKTSLPMLIKKPYMPLFQEYQKCHDSERSTLANQAGITIGNIQLLAPFVVCIAFLLSVCYSLCVRPTDDERYDATVARHYTRTEKQQTLDTLAVAMLIHRDRILAEELAVHTPSVAVCGGKKKKTRCVCVSRNNNSENCVCGVCGDVRCVCEKKKKNSLCSVCGGSSARSGCVCELSGGTACVSGDNDHDVVVCARDDEDCETVLREATDGTLSTSTLHRLVRDMVRHYNDRETKRRVLSFLKHKREEEQEMEMEELRDERKSESERDEVSERDGGGDVEMCEQGV